jgi:hypothetical protein
MLRLCALLVCLAATAQAGPWPRAAGETFVDGGVEIPLRDGDGYAGLYAEYGLQPRLTIGLDLGGDRADMTKALAFLRVPLGAETGPWRRALEIGAGLAEDRAALRPGISLGRGLRLWDHDAWISLDSRAVVLANRRTGWSSDATLGLNRPGGDKVIVQLRAGRAVGGDPYLDFAPAYVLAGQSGRHLLLGVAADLRDGERIGARIGLWHRF